MSKLKNSTDNTMINFKQNKRTVPCSYRLQSSSSIFIENLNHVFFIFKLSNNLIH